MTNHTSIGKRLLCLLVTISLLMAYLPGIAPTADAASDSPAYSIVADASTADNWKNYFGSTMLDTSYAGAVWTDKTVFTQATLPSGSVVNISDPKHNFLVALSAIAANKSIVGHSNIPTDTMLVLDISNSMITAGAVDELVTATNDAITRLLALNNNNRVGVILYSSEDYSSHNVTGDASTILLPLDRYTTSNNVYLNYSSETVTIGGNGGPGGGPGGGGGGNRTETRHYITVNSNVKDGNSTAVNPSSTSNRVEGGTYIQSGLDTAMDLFLAVTPEDTKIQSGFQAGKNRMPVIVLMSDGAPTYATTQIANVGDSNVGSGSSSSNINAFLTQLTAAYTKANVKAHYNGVDPLLYTLGLGVESDSNATAVLNPTSSNSTINGWWKTYIESTGDQNGTVGIRNNNRNYYVSKVSDLTSVAQQYYADQHFEADTASDLEDAFDAMVQQIIIQSLYYPTLAEDGEHNFGGYLSFVDDIGEFMEVVGIRGIQLGNTLFSGAELSKNFATGSSGGNLGTLANPTDLGNEFVRAVIDRFGFDEEDSPYYGDYNAQLAAAHDLIELAYSYGQLSYTDENNFSNYIGSYQDVDGNFISFYNEGTTTVPKDSQGRQAAYKIKSYGMLGSVQDGMKKSDMMYISIQVRTEILPDGSDGKTAVIWQIPAALIPVVSYNITVEGADSMEDITANSNISVEIKEADPIRLLFEVGLRSDINEVTLSDIMKAEGINKSNDSVFVNADGSYTFLTNRYDLDGFTANASPSHDMNAVSYFEPSKENERYYYNTNTTILVKGAGNTYSPYTGSTAPNVNGTYYREYDVFVYNKAASKWVYSPYHEEISSESLALAQKNGNNTWYVPAGTIHRITATSPVSKVDDTITNTLDYSMYPTIEKSGTHYYVDSILGNNGALTMVPATGLKLSKVVDSSLSGTTEEFTFNIVSSGLSGVYEAIHMNASGDSVLEGIESVTFTSGSATVQLKAGESLLILVPAGSYQITEVIEIGNHYTVSKITVDETPFAHTVTAQATVADQKITNVTYENTYQVNNGYGNLVITKAVTGVDPADPNLSGKRFTFDVTLTNSQINVNGQTYTTSVGTVTTDIAGRFTVQLKAGESFSIHDIPANTQVSVTERNNPDGFTVVDAATKTTAIRDQETSTVAFVNHYRAASINANIAIGGDKTLTGRDWLDGEQFQFYLQSFNTATNTWTDVDGAVATVTKANKSYQINFSHTYDTPGTYLYRVLEKNGGDVINGVHYSNVTGNFRVVVTDDLSGKLSADVIIDGSNGSVAPGSQSGSFAVDVDFTNNYIPDGNVTVKIHVQKAVTCSANTVHDLAGYTFGLYAADGTLISTAATDAQGKAIFTLSYGPNFVDQTMNYTVHEIVPADPMDGMQYNTTPVNVQVKVSDIEQTGTLTAVVTTDQDAANADTDTTIHITNHHQAGAASIELAGLKTLIGRHLSVGEFRFALYRATDSTFNVPAGATALQTVSNTELMSRASAYNYAFDPILFSSTGTNYFVVREVNSGITGITYDTTEYHITVVVEDDDPADADANLETTVTIVKVQGVTETPVVTNNTSDTGFQGLDFTNTYTPSGNIPAVNVPINKVITDLSNSGNTFAKGGYKFGLYLDTAFTQAVMDANGNPIVAVTDQNGNATITIPAITDTANVTAGTIYNYYLKEEAHTVAGMRPNTQCFHIHVEVLDNGDGTFGAKSTIHADGHFTTVDTATFVNTYDPSDVSVVIEGFKTLNGRDMAANEFEFHLYQVADDSFTIPTNATVLLSAKNSAAANGVASAFRFDPLKFDTAGKYYYVVIEHHSGRTAHGVKHSDAVYNVVITVSNNAATGKLGYTMTVNGSSSTPIRFVNTYSNTPATNNVTILGEKILKDRPWLSIDSFKFKVDRFTGLDWNDTTKADETNWLQVGNSVAATKESGGKFDLSAALPTEFPAAGTYYYRITEIGGGATVNGVTYSSEKVYFAVAVGDNGVGSLAITNVIADNVTGNAKDGYTVSASFINTYASSGTVPITITGSKYLTNRKLQEKEFAFDLIDSDGKVIETVRNEADGSFTFKELLFTKVGVYTFTIEENQSVTADRVTNDKTKFKVTVTVTDNYDGTISAKSTVENLTDPTDKSGKISFTNVYDPENVNVVIKGDKILNGRDMTAGEFNFLLYQVADSSFTIPADAAPLQKVSGGAAANGVASNFHFEALPFHTDGVFYYVVVEDNAGATIHGVKYATDVYKIVVTITRDPVSGVLSHTMTVNGSDATPIRFVNTYSYAPAANNVTILGEKILKDRPWLDTDSFAFKVDRFAGLSWSDAAKADEANWMQSGSNVTATKANGGKIDLSGCLPTSFPAPGTYHYRISEIGGGTTVNGVTYSGDKVYFSIVVEDNGKGQLEITSVTSDKVTGDADKGYTVSASFTNTYAVSGSVPITITGNKHLSNRDLQEKEFAFDLIDADGKVIETVRNGEKGAISFKELLFTKVGVYTFTVEENQSVTADRVTNDKTKFKVTVTVTDNYDGSLSAKYVVENLSDPTDTSGKIAFTNVYTPKPADISVKLDIVKTMKILGDKVLGADGFQFELKDGSTEEILQTVTSDEEGLASIFLSFGEEQIGKHTYKLVEKNTGVEGVTYSDAVYNIEITVSLGADNTLVASIVCNSETVEHVSATFENIYDVDESPKTGDQMDLMMWLCLLVISGGLTVTMIRPVLRKKED